MKPEDALQQIAYMHKLIDETRLRLADLSPHFMLWGVLWMMIYLGPLLLEESSRVLIWLLAVSIGVVGSALIGVRQRGAGGKSMPVLGARLVRVNLLLFFLAILIPILFQESEQTRINAYWPLFIGITFLVDGIFISRVLTWTGLWLVMAAIASLFLSPTAQGLWLGLAGGGALLVIGVLLRRFLGKVG